MAAKRQQGDKAGPIAWPEGVRLASGRVRGRRAAGKAAPAALTEQRGRHRRGGLSEIAAAALLVLKGYVILGRHVRTRHGEIDIIARRGRRLAFVEVKYRRTDEAAATAISDWQAERIAAAAEHWVWRHPRYRDCEIGLDAVLVSRYRIPVHVANALQSA